MHLHRIFLYLDLEIFSAFGAAYGMLAPFIRQAQGCLAIRTGAIAMGFAVAELILLQPKPSFDLAAEFQILLVLHLPLIDVFGKDAEHHPDHQRPYRFQCRKEQLYAG